MLSHHFTVREDGRYKVRGDGRYKVRTNQRLEFEVEWYGRGEPTESGGASLCITPANERDKQLLEAQAARAARQREEEAQLQLTMSAIADAAALFQSTVDDTVRLGDDSTARLGTVRMICTQRVLERIRTATLFELRHDLGCARCEYERIKETTSVVQRRVSSFERRCDALKGQFAKAADLAERRRVMGEWRARDVALTTLQYQLDVVTRACTEAEAELRDAKSQLKDREERETTVVMQQ